MPLTNKGPLDEIEPEHATLDHPVWEELLPEFEIDEFESPEKMDVGFLRLIIKARRLAGCPFRVLDTVRDSSRSAHGEDPCAATDLQAVNSWERSRIVRAAYAVGFIRVGVYPGSDGVLNGRPRRDKGGIHIDGSRTKPQDRLWTMKLRRPPVIHSDR